MLTVVDFIDLWGDTPMAHAAAAMVATRWRGARFYIPKNQVNGRFGANGRFFDELREVVKRHGGGDAEMDSFCDRWGGQDFRL